AQDPGFAPQPPVPAPYSRAPQPLPQPAAPHQPMSARDPEPWAHPAAFPIGPDGLPVHPMSRREWREWRRNYRQQMKFGGDGRPVKTIGERIIHFRKHVVGNASVIAMLGGINMLTDPRFPWFLFPAIFMAVGIVKEW